MSALFGALPGVTVCVRLKPLRMTDFTPFWAISLLKSTVLSLLVAT